MDNTPTPPTGAGLALPRRRLLKRPWTSDWVFWLVIVISIVGGAAGAYQEGQRTATGGAVWAALIASIVDTGVFALTGFLVFGLIPAVTRWLVTMPLYRRRLATKPGDRSAGWRPDPLDNQRQRWWTGDGWARATNPEEPSDIGHATRWLIFAAVAVLFIALFAGRASGPGTTMTLAPPADTTTSTEANPDAFPVGDVVAFHYGEVVRSLVTASQVPDSEVGTKENLELGRQLFIDLQENYEPLKDALDRAQTQQDIGGSAPNLSALRAFVDALGPYVTTQEGYYNDLDQCGPIRSVDEWGPCEEAAFETWSTPILDSTQPLIDAFDAVNASLPERP